MLQYSIHYTSHLIIQTCSRWAEWLYFILFFWGGHDWWWHKSLNVSSWCSVSSTSFYGYILVTLYISPDRPFWDLSDFDDGDMKSSGLLHYYYFCSSPTHVGLTSCLSWYFTEDQEIRVLSSFIQEILDTRDHFTDATGRSFSCDTVLQFLTTSDCGVLFSNGIILKYVDYNQNLHVGVFIYDVAKATWADSVVFSEGRGANVHDREKNGSNANSRSDETFNWTYLTAICRNVPIL